MSADLSARIQLGLDQLAEIRGEISILIARTSTTAAGVLETSAASAMLHSFYTEIEKVLKWIAADWDGSVPSTDSWHKDLLNQMAAQGVSRPPVIGLALVEALGEFLAFRHLFRGASIVLMRWDKLAPLVDKVDLTYGQFLVELTAFQKFLNDQPQSPR